MKFMVRMRLLLSYLQLVRDPNKTEKIINLVWTLGNQKDHPAVETTLGEVLRHKSFRESLERRDLPRFPSRDEVAKLPEGTLGRALYEHMEQNHLSWDLFSQDRHEDGDIQYLSTRLLQAHDIWHALLGYGVSIADELAIQAFTVAQIRSGLSLTLISGGLLHVVMFRPREVFQTFERVVEGYQQGRRARFLLDFRLEEMLERPLDEVREICGVTRPQFGAAKAPAISQYAPA